MRFDGDPACPGSMPRTPRAFTGAPTPYNESGFAA
jgi:hypothetical protein